MIQVFNGKSNTRTMIEVGRYSPMRPATHYLETSFVGGQKLQELKSRELQRTDRRFWYGMFQYQGSGRISSVDMNLGWFHTQSKILQNHLIHNARNQICSTLAIAVGQWSKTQNSSSQGLVKWRSSRNNRLANKKSRYQPSEEPLVNLNHLIKSIKSRCLAPIESKGERINYWF